VDSQAISDAHLDVMLSSICDFSYLFDRQGRFLYANKALLDLWGLTLDQAVGRNFFDLRDLEKSIARTDRLPDATVSGAILNDMEEAIGAPPTAVAHVHSVAPGVWRGTTPTARPER